MKDFSAYVSIGVVCLVVLMILFFKDKMEYFVRLVLRGAMGLVMIYVVNQIFQFVGIECFVGVIPLSSNLIISIFFARSCCLRTVL